MENEDADPVGEINPVCLAKQDAMRIGLIAEGQELDEKLKELWKAGVERAASLADLYPNIDVPEDTVGDIIRAGLVLPMV